MTANSFLHVALLGVALQDPRWRPQGGRGALWGFGAALGTSVDVSRDGIEELVCSAPYGKRPTVFVLSGADLSVVRTLTAADERASFGESLGRLIAERLDLLLIGSPRRDGLGGTVVVADLLLEREYVERLSGA
jgi:hypothetical protein